MKERKVDDGKRRKKNRRGPFIWGMGCLALGVCLGYLIGNSEEAYINKLEEQLREAERGSTNA